MKKKTKGRKMKKPNASSVTVCSYQKNPFLTVFKVLFFEENHPSRLPPSVFFPP